MSSDGTPTLVCAQVLGRCARKCLVGVRAHTGVGARGYSSSSFKRAHLPWCAREFWVSARASCGSVCVRTFRGARGLGWGGNGDDDGDDGYDGDDMDIFVYGACRLSFFNICNCCSSPHADIYMSIKTTFVIVKSQGNWETCSSTEFPCADYLQSYVIYIRFKIFTLCTNQNNM